MQILRETPCPQHQNPDGRFRRYLGEAGVEELLAKTIETAVATKAIPLKNFERVIVDMTVQEKAIAHPTDSRLLDIARAKLVQLRQASSTAFSDSTRYADKGHRIGNPHSKGATKMSTKIKTRPFDIAEYLDDDEAIAVYLNGIMEEDNPSLLADALGNIARAKGMTQIAKISDPKVRE